jgi:hypothetical protein
VSRCWACRVRTRDDGSTKTPLCARNTCPITDRRARRRQTGTGGDHSHEAGRATSIRGHQPSHSIVPTCCQACCGLSSQIIPIVCSANLVGRRLLYSFDHGRSLDGDNVLQMVNTLSLQFTTTTDMLLDAGFVMGVFVSPATLRASRNELARAGRVANPGPFRVNIGITSYG